LLLLGLAALGFLLGDAALRVKSLERTVTVKGLSEREVPADIAIWPISTQVASNEIAELYALIQKNNQAIIDYLAGYDIAPAEITVTPPTVTDMHAQQYGNRENIKFRYSAVSTITVYSEAVEKVRSAMAGVIELGKQGIVLTAQDYQHKTQFLFTGLSGLKPEMVEEATLNARGVAAKFAADSGSRLGKIKRANQGLFTIKDRDSTTPYIKKVRVVSTVEYYLSD
jgi:hypothetical protein